MIKYAREDTHYLLYIYDRLRNDLVARGNASNNLILAVLNRSKAICLKKYRLLHSPLSLSLSLFILMLYPGTRRSCGRKRAT
jgi:hypothetical protein